MLNFDKRELKHVGELSKNPAVGSIKLGQAMNQLSENIYISEFSPRTSDYR